MRDKHGVERWHVRVTMPDGSRPYEPIPEDLTSEDEAKARAIGAKFSTWIRSRAAVPVVRGLTVNEYFDDWIADREGKGLRTARSDRGRYSKWIAPQLGTMAIREVGRSDLRKLVAHLDEAVRASKIAGKTAIHIWAVATKMFSDATDSKNDALIVRTDNPAESVRAPDREDQRESTFLHPSEFLTLAGCSLVPLHWRHIYTLATYFYLRAGELAALEWEDFNFAQRYVLVHRSLNTETGKVKKTKTGRGRMIPIEPSILPLLQAMHHEADGEGRVVDMPPMCEWAAKLRHYLKLAGVTRAALFANDETRRWLTFHDLRHTGITWRAVRGDRPVEIKDHAGHSSLDMTMRYVEMARVFDRGAFGEPFPRLPRSLFPDPSEVLPEFCPGEGFTAENAASPAGVEPALAT